MPIPPPPPRIFRSPPSYPPPALLLASSSLLPPPPPPPPTDHRIAPHRNVRYPLPRVIRSGVIRIDVRERPPRHARRRTTSGVPPPGGGVYGTDRYQRPHPIGGPRRRRTACGVVVVVGGVTPRSVAEGRPREPSPRRVPDQQHPLPPPPLPTTATAAVVVRLLDRLSQPADVPSVSQSRRTARPRVEVRYVEHPPRYPEPFDPIQGQDAYQIGVESPARQGGYEAVFRSPAEGGDVVDRVVTEAGAYDDGYAR